MAQQEFPQHYPEPGWVEHDPDDLWQSSLAVMRRVIAEAGVAPGAVAALGIANQRETVLVWEPATPPGAASWPSAPWTASCSGA